MSECLLVALCVCSTRSFACLQQTVRLGKRILFSFFFWIFFFSFSFYGLQFQKSWFFSEISACQLRESRVDKNIKEEKNKRVRSFTFSFYLFFFFLRVYAMSSAKLSFKLDFRFASLEFSTAVLWWWKLLTRALYMVWRWSAIESPSRQFQHTSLFTGVHMWFIKTYLINSLH